MYNLKWFDYQNTRFSDLLKVATTFFGEPRVNGSHHVFKVGRQGHPINIQSDRGKAKEYQVKQVLEEIEKLEKKDEENK